MTGTSKTCLGSVIWLFIAAPAAVPQLPAPQPANRGVVDIPGVGRVDFDKLPPDIRDNIRIPGRTYYDPPEKYEDLPPLPPDPDPVPEPKVGLPPEIESEKVAPKNEAGEAKGAPAELPIEEALKRMRDERAFPSGEIPEDAYQKAWEHIQRMQPAVPPSEPASKDLTDPSAEPESWLTAPLRWLTRAWNHLSGDSAVAQIPPHYWYSIGPAGIVGDPGAVGDGIVEWIAVDPQSVIANPQNPQKIYLGTLEGGIWKTGDGGTTWLPATDSLVPVPSLQVEAIAVHPNNSSMVFTGTGINCCQQDPSDTQRTFGMYRTADGGSTWCRIGPSCPDSTHCPGTDYTHSDLVVPQVAVEPTSPYRVWAATSKGLFYSDDAALTGSCTASCDCSGVHWTLTTLPKKNDNLTPNYMLHFFLSPSSSQTVYAAIIKSDAMPPRTSDNGWWKSANHGSTWNQVLRLPNGLEVAPTPAQDVRRAAITKGSNGDVIYSIYGDAEAPTPCADHSKGSRLYRTTNSGTSWTALSTSLDCSGSTNMQVVAADPGDLTGQTIAVGTFGDLFRSTDGGGTFQDVGPGSALHVDHKALLFVPPPTPGPPSLLFAGNDGGIWKTANFTAQSVNWTDLNNLYLANVLFYYGTIDSLNYVASAAGSQDNAAMKAGAPVVWTDVGAFGDAGQIIIDPTNSNIQYFETILEATVNKTFNGGKNIVGKAGGLPSDNAGVRVADGSLAMDPSDHNTLLVYANSGNDTSRNRVYRTTTGGEGSAAWVAVSPAPTPGVAVPAVRSFAFAPVPAPTPRSSVIFAATKGDGVWQTTNANDPAPTWAASRTGLPDRVLRSIAIDTAQCPPSQPTCTASCPCTLYVAANGFDDNAQPPFASHGHVFRTVYSGQAWSSVMWDNISGDLTSPTCQANPSPCLPNIPINKVVLHPAVRNTVYVGTDTGIFQGCLGCKSSDGSTCNPAGSSWICNSAGTMWFWGTFMNGFPPAAQVLDLAVHADSGYMRAFTFGRGAWESKPFTPATTDIRVNTSGVNVNATAVGPRLSSGRTGTRYSISWADDRIGANNFHAYYRGYGYDANNKPTPLGADFRVDDTYSTHVVQGVSVAQYRNANVTPIYARVAWHDNRNGVNNVFFNLVYSDGSRLFSQDLQGDQAGPGLNAKNPSVVPLLSTDVFLAWQQDRTTGTNPPQDVYGNYFQGIGPPYTPPCKIGFTAASAQRPVVAADSHDQVFVVWEDPPRIYASEYDKYGDCLIGSGMDCSGSGLSCAALPSHPPASVALDDGGGPANMIRSQPAITIDDADNVIVTWWESDPALAGARIVAKRCNNQLASCTFLDSQCGKKCKACVGGAKDGQACLSNADCPNGLCDTSGPGSTACLADSNCPAAQCSRVCACGTNNCTACTSNADCPTGECPLAVSCPPAIPSTANTAKTSSVAALVPPTPGAASTIAVAWQGNVNNPGASLYSGFARSFDASLGKLRNDFRFDRAYISDVEDARVARTSLTGQAVFVWRDNRLNNVGSYNVYTQAVPAQ